MELIPGLTNDLARECLIRVPFGSFPSILSVSKAWNTEVRNPEFHRLRRLSGRTRPHLVLALKAWPWPDLYPSAKKKSEPFHWLIAFDPESGSWTRFPPAPRLPFDEIEFCRVVAVGSDIVVVTAGMIGYNYEYLNVVQVFDLLTSQWRRGSDIPGPGRSRFGLAGDPVRRVVMVAGGEPRKYRDTYMRSALLYDLAKDIWVPLVDMERERSKSDVILHGGKFHVINMVGSDEMIHPNRAETLDPDTWQWGPGDVRTQELDSERYNRYWMTWNEEDEMYRLRLRLGDDVEVERGNGKEWQSVAQLPIELTESYISCLMTWNDKMVVVGGPFESDVMQHDAFILDLKSYKWRQVALPEKDSSFADVASCCGLDLLFRI